jgi:cytoskeletal protein CcmA (bactofilin family)
MSIAMEQGVHFSGRCSMLESGSETIELTGGSMTR